MSKGCNLDATFFHDISVPQIYSDKFIIAFLGVNGKALRLFVSLKIRALRVKMYSLKENPSNYFDAAGLFQSHKYNVF